MNLHARREPLDPAEELTGSLLSWINDLDRADATELYGRLLCEMARDLLDAGADATATSRAIADANDALTVRLFDLAVKRLGPPPCPYAWLALGSAGRREEALHSDQDNALAFQDPAAEGYFAELAKIVVGGLREAGRPLCAGGFMATRWCHPPDRWRGIFRRWIEGPEPQDLVEAEVLLDFRRIHGSLSLTLLDDIIRHGSFHPRFQTHMAGAAVAFAPPLGLFGRVRIGNRARQVDLKRGGIAAIVLLGRVYAIAARCVERPTAQRLAAAADSGILSHDGAARLTEAYEFLTHMRWRTQVQRIAEGGMADNLVAWDILSRADRVSLRDAFRTVRQIQQATALLFHVEALP